MSRINGTSKSDTLVGKDELDIIFGDDGDDFLSGKGTFYGGRGDDQIDGGAGNDGIGGGEGNDTLNGGAGNDGMGGDEGDDTLNGGEGNDFLDGGSGNDSLAGGLGNDSLNDGEGNDYLDGGEGNDHLSNFGGDNVLLFGGPGNDILGNSGENSTVWGGEGDDSLWGNNFDDNLYGEQGNDCLSGSYGNDYLDGGEGNDIINGGEDEDSLKGGQGNDILYTGIGSVLLDSNNVLWGEEGNDTLNGGKGDDTLNGGNGDDYLLVFGKLATSTFANDSFSDYLLEGGTGNDTYELSWSPAGSVINDVGGTNDALLLYKYDTYSPEMTLSRRLAIGITGVFQDNTSLIVDINQDGKANRADDLTILNFYSAIRNENDVITGYKPGPGYIEKMNFADDPADKSLIVNSTGDAPDAEPNDGVADVNIATPGLQTTFRAAIQVANAQSGKDTITFNIPTGALTIQPQSALPTITDAVIIDATTQPGIEIDGSNAGTNTHGLTITGGNSTIHGLTINRFSGDGIRLEGNGGNVIEKNKIGTDTSGTKALGNDGSGIVILSQNNTIDGNLISGNKLSGVSITGTIPNENTIKNNLIGTDISGTQALGNLLNGVFIGEAAKNTLKDNVISGNQDDGIDIRGQTATGNIIQGNKIGVDKAGTKNLANKLRGVVVDDSASNNIIGGKESGIGNIIGFNGKAGVSIASGTGNSILGNAIFRNEGSGIDLNNDGFTPNDFRDQDTGANQLQNYPVLTSVTQSNGVSTIEGIINTIPNASYRLEFFAENPNTPGQILLGYKDITTDRLGNIIANDDRNSENNQAGFIGLKGVDGYINGFQFIPPEEVKNQLLKGATFTVTATDSSNNTSEFFPWNSFTTLKGSVTPKANGSTIESTFIPDPYKLSEIAAALGVDHFNWVHQEGK